MPPLEIQVFSPSRHMRVAVAACARGRSAATSEPASGSDSAKAAIASPVAHRRQLAALQLVASRRARSGRCRGPASRRRNRRGRHGSRASRARGRARARRAADASRRTRAGTAAERSRASPSAFTQRAARGVDIVMRQLAASVRVRPARQLAREARGDRRRRTARSACRCAACQLPSKTGFCFAAKAR